MLNLGLVGLWFGWSELQPYRARAETYELDRIDEVEEPSFILDRKGREIGRMFVENRAKVPIEAVPEKLIEALLAQEDQRFWDHDGVDWTGIARAGYLTVRQMEFTQGASTITMQLARNAFDLKSEAEKRGESTMERKFVEAFLALRIEKEMAANLAATRRDAGKTALDSPELKRQTKRQILEFYLNRVPFGSGYYGIRSAALGYYGKEPADLELQECASLIACLKNPSLISPLNNPETNKLARDHVLNRMELEGMIDKAERDRLKALPIDLDPKPILRGKSQLYELIAKQARLEVGEEAMSRGGFTIHTTIDLDLQHAAESSLSRILTETEASPGYSHPKRADFSAEGSPDYLQGSVLAVNHQTGEVLAYVGGRDYADSQYDFIESGARPTGTAIFPFIYASAFENGASPATHLEDEPMDNRRLMVGGREGVVGEWGMESANPRHEGEITARRGLADSKIGATVRLGVDTGLEKVVGLAREFGLEVPDQKLLSRLLVGWDPLRLPDMVSAYGAFPRGGTRLKENFYIRRITDQDGQSRYESPLEGSGPQAERVCSEATAFQIHSILNDTLANGNLAEEGKSLAPDLLLGGVKTGTPYGFSDAWALGYTSRVTCGVWIGFLQGGQDPIMEGAFARKLAFPVWKEVMEASVGSYASTAIEPPSSVKEVLACRVSGMTATRYCSEAITTDDGRVMFQSTAYPEFFKKGEKVGICEVHGPGGDAEAIAGVTRQEALPVIPIRPKAPLLIGADPYRSELPALAPEGDDSSFLLMENTLVVDDKVAGEKEALISLPRPGRTELIEAQ